MELTITKEKVLEAASKCSTAKATLEVLFPEIFDQPEAIDNEVVFPRDIDIRGCNRERLIENRVGNRMALWLSNEFTWTITEVIDGGYELTATRK